MNDMHYGLGILAWIFIAGLIFYFYSHRNDS